MSAFKEAIFVSIFLMLVPGMVALVILSVNLDQITKVTGLQLSWLDCLFESDRFAHGMAAIISLAFWIASVKVILFVLLVGISPRL